MLQQDQLHVALTLAGAALVSLALRLSTRDNAKQPSLLVSASGDDSLVPDPFDVVKPEDCIDGIPIAETVFWTRTHLRKFVLSVVLAVILALQSISLGWSVIEGERRNVAVCALHVVFALYILALSVHATMQTGSKHAHLIAHLFALALLATVLLTVTAILPSKHIPSVSSLFAFSTSPPTYLGYAVHALYVAAFIIAGTTPRGPELHFPPEDIYFDKGALKVTSRSQANVSGITSESVFGVLIFSYMTKVTMLGKTVESIDIGDLPILAADMRATALFARMRAAMRRWQVRIGTWSPTPGSGIELAYRLVRVNAASLLTVCGLAVLAAGLFYVPAFFIRRLIHYLEIDNAREAKEWGILFAIGIFASDGLVRLLTAHIWTLSTTTLQVRFRIQLNSLLFAKTLVRKDVASFAAQGTTEDISNPQQEDADSFSSKAQIMTLMTTDVDRIAGFAQHLYTIVDAPLEIAIATWFLYYLLGPSCFLGLGVIFLFLPLNHLTGTLVIGTQTNLMQARDERVSLMNEILGGIRMLKFMAWERNFEKRVHDIRNRELKYQKRSYMIETLLNAIWNASPILVTLATFWHFAVYRQQTLTPSIAFTSLGVFNEMKFAMVSLPETLINLYQSAVSLRRIETYLQGAEVESVPPLDNRSQPISLRSATITWAQDRSAASSAAPSAPSTPKHKFILKDLTLEFPHGELSLICGKLGSGKSLLLLAFLGEADVLSGQVLCPRTPPNTLASFAGVMVPQEKWIVQGVCAYVPQSAWLRNASIKDNILFDLPYVEERYRKTLEVCALLSDLDILEDGDESEIGERGVGLSGGQKARVSLARAVYSRASTLFLDDVLSAVDAHTAHHLYHQCLKGELMHGRTIILVSHHVQLCAPGASYIVSLDNGSLQYAGDYDSFQISETYQTLVQLGVPDNAEKKEEQTAEPTVEEVAEDSDGVLRDSTDAIAKDGVGDTVVSDLDKKAMKKPPRKVVEDEKRAKGNIGKDIWAVYIRACGGYGYWLLFALAMGFAALTPVMENGWLRIWSSSYLDAEQRYTPAFYIGIYALISVTGLILTTLRFFVVFHGGINASMVLYEKLLETVLFANIRYHDTSSRGRLLNRFGKDFEAIDSNLPNFFAQSVIHALGVVTTVITMSVVGGPSFMLAAVVFAFLYYNTGKVYGQTSRDLRRLDSVTRSPLYTIYGEAIAGVAVVRAFGASSKFLRDMLRFTDTNANPYFWAFGINRWLSSRFSLLTSAVLGVTGLVSVLNPNIDASLAGFALTFAGSLLYDMIYVVHRYVGLEQSMVGVERVKEFFDLPKELAEFVEPRPPASWPTNGAIKCENLVIRYAPDLPDVLHNLTFDVNPGEKVGVLGRTGSGKSTLALSFFRFVEPTEGCIYVDGQDISKVGLTDLRSRLTIIPQDPIILSGTLRSTLDVLNEYEDTEIYEALRRVHLIPSSEHPEETDAEINVNVFRNLDSPVSEGGENFSTGEKQLLCMARAILKRSKVLFMDEATASVDYATDELIGKTIRQEFAQSTILTIAHRLRTIIDYDRVMILDQGHIVEFDKPAVLLSDPSSSFYALCKATGPREFAMLKRMAGL
ncbi:multidrug resistance-associated ABC transporter [Daedaleopsis nitida]|nr:multidrug resistance-associated ABC transporter [Daedaleopsis nitida]